MVGQATAAGSLAVCEAPSPAAVCADLHSSGITVACGEEKSNWSLGQERIAGPRTVLSHQALGRARLKLDEGDFAAEVRLLFRVEFQSDAAGRCDAL
jgi:hypothetical protein